MSGRPRAFLLAAAAAVGVLSFGANDARADDPPKAGAAETPDAAETKRRGDDALVSGRPADALAAYKEAYALRPDAALVYNIGRAYQALGDFPNALEQLEQFEATAPPEVRARVPGLATLLAEVRRRVAVLAVVVDVEGATVRLDQRVLGKSPLRAPVKVNAGIGTLSVEKEGYFPFEHAITLPGGGVTASDVKLASKQTKAIVTVRSVTAGARVTVDGKEEGSVPTDVVIAPGAHQIELSLDGYRTMRSTLAVAAGERRSVDLALEKEAPITKKWWFWTGVGLVVVGATVTVIALTTERGPDSGNVAPGRINTGLTF